MTRRADKTGDIGDNWRQTGPKTRAIPRLSPMLQLLQEFDAYAWKKVTRHSPSKGPDARIFFPGIIIKSGDTGDTGDTLVITREFCHQFFRPTGDNGDAHDS